jgi:predicted TIM-barrel fold metal-dependent hydrolase
MLSRRSFLNNTLGAGLVLTTAQQVAAQTPAVQPARNRLIVDAQVHLWKAESSDWPWVPGMKPQMPEPFTIEKLVPLMDEAGVDRAVIVPPSWPGDRNDYGIEAAKRYPNRFAVMGRIPLKNPESAALLPRKRAARDARRPSDRPRPRRRMAHGWHRRLVLASSRESRAPRHVPEPGADG